MSRHTRQRGMSLVVAIFLIVIIASLAAFAVTVGTATRESTNMQLLADRAQAAAHAGTEWAAYQVRVTGACTDTNLLLLDGALRDFRVSITCTLSAGHSEGALLYDVYDVTSFAQWSNFGAANYASRSIEARFTTAP